MNKCLQLIGIQELIIYFLKLLGDEIHKWFDSIHISECQGQIKLCVQFVPNDEYDEYIPSESMDEMAEKTLFSEVSIEDDSGESSIETSTNSGKIYKKGPPPKPPQKSRNVSDDIEPEFKVMPLDKNLESENTSDTEHLQQKVSKMPNISNELNLLFQKKNKDNDYVIDNASTFLHESNCGTELDSDTESGADNESFIDNETENISIKDYVSGEESQDENTSNSGDIDEKLNDGSSNDVDLDSIGSTTTLTHFKKPISPKNRQTRNQQKTFGEESDVVKMSDSGHIGKQLDYKSRNDFDLDSVPSIPTLTHFKKPTPPKNRQTWKKLECFGEEFDFENKSDFAHIGKKLDYISNNDVDLDSVPSTPTLSHFKKPKPPKNRQTLKKVELFGEEFEVENKSDSEHVGKKFVYVSNNDVDLDSVPFTPTLTQFKKPKPPKNRQTTKQYEISAEENISADKELDVESGNEFGIENDQKEKALDNNLESKITSKTENLQKNEANVSNISKDLNFIFQKRSFAAKMPLKEDSDVGNIAGSRHIDKKENDEPDEIGIYNKPKGESTSEEITSEKIKEIAQSERSITEHLGIFLKRRSDVEDLEKKGEQE